jgi:hypothetical protein
MDKDYCKIHIIADLSNVFRNTPKPHLDIIELDNSYIHSLKELKRGQLFFYSYKETIGSLTIKVEPIDILRYKRLVSSYDLMKSGISGNIRHVNMVSNSLNSYYDKYLKSEVRNKKIETILKDNL